MTSICRSNTICRESPTRSAFSIVVLPLLAIREQNPPRLGFADQANRQALPSRGSL
jgi:hypothetical protein